MHDAGLDGPVQVDLTVLDVAKAVIMVQQDEYLQLRAERDMLARQLAEANRYIRDRLDMDAEDDGTYDRSIAPRAYNDSRIQAAIAVHQKQGVR